MSLDIKWLGHAGFRITFSDPTAPGLKRVIYVDTWLENPKIASDVAGTKPDDADVILVTHGHFDHSASAPDLLKWSSKPHSKIVANYEITLHYSKYHEIPEDRQEKMNAGGTIDLGFCQITMTTADHSSCCMCPNGDIANGGNPGGFVIHLPHLNARIYHGGDTNVFMDMELIEELNHPNILLIPIGDRFTMGPPGAALAVSRFFKSTKYVVPMHYGTFPLLTGTLEAFHAELTKRGVSLDKCVNTPDIKDGASWTVPLETL